MSISEGISNITTDDMLGSYKAVNYLLDLGHRDIAFVSARQIFRPTCESAADMKGDARSRDSIQGTNMSYTRMLMSRAVIGRCASCSNSKNRPTAVHAVNDQMAIGVMRAALENRLKIPEDLSVVGFSNSSISS